MSDNRKQLIPPPPHIYIVGAGGVASQLLPTLLKLMRRCDPVPEITIIDGDKLETRNLDRQLFQPNQVGQYKAEALARMFASDYPSPIRYINEWYMDGVVDVPIGALFLTCVDNHPARRAVLQTVDRTKGYAIMGGNEELDAESFYYDHSLMGTPYDPRVFYPIILTDNTDDPIREQAGCTGEALIARPQLALANMGAAYYMLQQLWFYFVEGKPKLGEDSHQFFPVRHYNNFSRCGTVMRLNLDTTANKKEQNDTTAKKEKAA